MKKKILTGIYIVMLLVCGKLAFNYIYNGFVTYCYHQQDYSVSVKPLMLFNWSQPYIAYYNQGNISYKNNNFSDAMISYEKALKLNPPEEKECAIRINLALAMLATLGEDYAAPENVEVSLEILKEAREVLLENGCATESGDGHSEKAEQLKEEIEAMIEQLEQQEPSESGDSKETEDEKEQEEQKEEEDNFEQDVKKTLQEQQSKANQERKESIDYYEDIDKDYNFDSDGLIW